MINIIIIISIIIICSSVLRVRPCAVSDFVALYHVFHFLPFLMLKQWTTLRCSWDWKHKGKSFMKRWPRMLLMRRRMKRLSRTSITSWTRWWKTWMKGKTTLSLGLTRSAWISLWRWSTSSAPWKPHAPGRLGKFEMV